MPIGETTIGVYESGTSEVVDERLPVASPVDRHGKCCAVDMVHQAGPDWLIEGSLVETMTDGERVFEGGLGVKVRECGRDGSVGQAALPTGRWLMGCGLGILLRT